MPLPTWYDRLRRHHTVQAVQRALTHRVAVVWGAGRRAWRRSLQLRMVTITLLVSGALVGGFGTLVATQIITGMVTVKVNAAVQQVRDGATRAAQQFGGVTDATDPSLPGLVRGVGQLLQPTTTSPDSQIIMAIFPETGRLPQSAQSVVPLVPKVGPDAIPRALHSQIAAGKVATEFIEANLDGNGTRQYLVAASAIRLSFGTFGLYYFFPLGAEQDYVNLVQTTVIATGVALVLLLGVMAALTTRLVVRPVRVAARTAQRLSAGLLDQRMEVRGEDDLALLAASFNQMAQNLQRQIIRLEDMSRLQRRFTSDVSHELRTPLTTVRMAADMIFNERSTFEPAVARSAELLQAELNRFEDLLTDLLEISRFDAGFAVLDAEPTDLVPLVAHVAERLTPLAGRCGVTLDVVLPDQPVIVEVDARRVERVLRNLIGNAVEHGERRPVEVRLVADDDAVALTVRDHGIGLQPGEEKQVFNRFWRADPSRARQTGGTGLGLSISLEDARLHGGWLEAWGEPGHGAQFRLTLPVRAGERLVASPLPLAPPDADREPAAEPALSGDSHA